MTFKAPTLNDKQRFDVNDKSTTMKAVITTGNGGYDKLEYKDVPIPTLEEGEVLMQVLAAGVNNTEINTRMGWYSASVTTGTEGLDGDEEERGRQKADGGWNEATPFPFIQGTDCCGRVVAVGPNADQALMGKRALIRACSRTEGWDSKENVWMASDYDGAFAQFVRIPASEVFPVDCDWTDAELGTIPCAYGTAETMLHRANVTANDHVLVAGASGGVGSATIQLAKCRGATVTAICGRDKFDQVKAIGADFVVARDEDLVEVLGAKSMDVAVDNVAGEAFSQIIEVLKRGGRYASSGAIAGPIVSLDMRSFYLKDLTLFGSTAWDEPAFPDLVKYIEQGKIKPLLAKTFPLEEIATAQEEFTKKKHVGKFVLLPPELTDTQKAYIDGLA
ncbi:alcohol dehydrogenase family protein [Marinomonas sp. C2222]|uniref:Alcohol dehydrogenase family protein n=1 Tax=Marinomonas sargassi TaxID=2984494 RepID=A0ABT2YPM7_9GAMM|nr:alcohol dehydrogenase family protein [Marinomonas sargassi]MCV2401839.1 alcohol dehydrogenase family protein [Marinomonas sargassi]